MTRLIKLWKLDPSDPKGEPRAFYVDPAVVVAVEEFPVTVGVRARCALVFHPPGAEKSSVSILADSPGRVALLVESAFDSGVPKPEDQDVPPGAPLQLVTP